MMQNVTSDHQPSPRSGQTGPDRTPKTRRHACDRCRRQKLRCDIQKPCSLCVRSGFDCVTTNAPLRKSKPSRRAARSNPREPKTPRRESPQERLLDREPPDSHGHNTINQRSSSFPDPYRHTQVSTIELTDELFQIHDPGSIPTSVAADNTTALPGANLIAVRCSNRQRQQPMIPFATLFPGLSLPPKPCCDFLVDAYRTSVHWFIMLFHQPTFEKEYMKIMDEQAIEPRQLGTAVLILMVLTMGARYTAECDSLEERDRHGDLKALQKDLLEHIQRHLFDVFDLGGVESIQICVLLSTFYLYNGRPNLAFPILGAGVRSAQALGLHNESLWGAADEITHEVRRRTWWALVVMDRFASITYGRPLSILDSDHIVNMPGNMDDSLASHPLLNSFESLDGQVPTKVTLMTYHRHKFQLYSIASPIIGHIYRLRSCNPQAVTHEAAEINTRLAKWFDKLPQELRLEHMADLDTSHLNKNDVETCKLFQLQALALQLAYDNIQIILHRPFLRYNHCLIGSSDPLPPDLRPTSFEQCRHCARRTCNILPRYESVLRAARTTHAVSYIAIQNFTAGVTLGMVALANPGSEQSQDAKRGVANSIALQKMLAGSSIVPLQTVKVLEHLFRLIFTREMHSMLRNPPKDMEAVRTGTHHQTSDQEVPGLPTPFGDSNSRHLHPSQAAGEFGATQSEPTRTYVNPEGASIPDIDFGIDWEGLSYNTGIDSALESVQQVLWKSSHLTTDTSSHSASAGLQTSLDVVEDPSGLQNDVVSQGTNSLGDPLCGQGWVWNWGIPH
ncbi:Zn(II)2Cys6 transcription factor [Aspergillus ibericus CBS 121593]|uniref:Zn(2)-C6 fungal-type domain-containing protein n=1 Tax=Aspergillus ibericus CBS 121593 TaxID=1448316 RepID=A0A395H5X4_9EURO|nr:hypothetical protein BO80DRAFT_23128 [Aspergillus ibericus CBS 121593]RAL03006.1 hypothetical protein BO80DRAFT_23128 [Aspergillus ibericus CBS 121593]